VSFTVEPADPQQSPVQFTLTNDFADEPIVVLTDARIPNFPAANTSSSSQT
jgi:hypothetical protein